MHNRYPQAIAQWHERSGLKAAWVDVALQQSAPGRRLVKSKPDDPEIHQQNGQHAMVLTPYSDMSIVGSAFEFHMMFV